MQGVLVSQLDESQLSEDLGVHDSQVIVDSLIENHVIDHRVDLLSDGSDPLDTVDIDVLQELVYLVMSEDLLYQSP